MEQFYILQHRWKDIPLKKEHQMQSNVRHQNGISKENNKKLWSLILLLMD